MKALSLLQPWASLLALGYKRIETRSWNTNYRGLILIHASKKYNIDQQTEAVVYGNMVSDSRIYHNNRGCIIGVANIIQTNTTDQLKALMNEQCNIFNEDFLHGKQKQELQFGDYSPGRYGWLMENARMFKEPIPAKGSLSLWDYDLDISKIEYL